MAHIIWIIQNYHIRFKTLRFSKKVTNIMMSSDRSINIIPPCILAGPESGLRTADCQAQGSPNSCSGRSTLGFRLEIHDPNF